MNPREYKTVTVGGLTWTIHSRNERSSTHAGRHFFAVRCKDWKRKEVWKRDGKNFMVEVSRHEVRVDDSGCYGSEGPHRWCLYVYVYPKHPAFSQFDASGQMYEQPSFGMHCGNSYFRTWRNEAGVVTSYQVGSDYSHDGDWHFTQMATPEDAYEVFNDADEIFDALSTQATQP